MEILGILRVKLNRKLKYYCNTEIECSSLETSSEKSYSNSETIEPIYFDLINNFTLKMNNSYKGTDIPKFDGSTNPEDWLRILKIHFKYSEETRDKHK